MLANTICDPLCNLRTAFIRLDDLLTLTFDRWTSIDLVFETLTFDLSMCQFEICGIRSYNITIK